MQARCRLLALALGRVIQRGLSLIASIRSVVADAVKVVAARSVGSILA